MRILIVASVICFYSSFVFAQEPANKVVYVKISEMNKRVLNRTFPDIPESVRELHATGTFVLKVNVDENGNVSRALVVSGFSKLANDYVQKTVNDWKFRPLTIKGKNSPFVGTLTNPFCYGALDTTLGGLCGS